MAIETVCSLVGLASAAYLLARALHLLIRVNRARRAYSGVVRHGMVERSSGSVRVLLVDDHLPFAKTVTAAFLQAHAVTLANSLADARRAVVAQSFDVVLIDHDLPDGKGGELVAELQRTCPQSVIVGISAHDGGNTALVRAGAKATCSKTRFSQIGTVIAAAVSSAARQPLGTILFTAASGARNEDRGVVLPTRWGTVVCVADGAGGTGTGHRAAELALSTIGKIVSSSSMPLGGHRLAATLLSIDRELSITGAGAETSCVFTEIVENQIVGASVGDSGALLVGDDGIKDLTADQVRKPLLGSGAASPLAFGPVALDGLLVVATDGLIKYVPRTALQKARAASDLVQARDLLLDAVRLRSGAFPDDITFVLTKKQEGADKS